MQDGYNHRAKLRHHRRDFARGRDAGIGRKACVETYKKCLGGMLCGVSMGLRVCVCVMDGVRIMVMV